MVIKKKLIGLIFAIFLIGGVFAAPGPSWSVEITKLNDEAIVSNYGEPVTKMTYNLNLINCSQVDGVWFSDDEGNTLIEKGCPSLENTLSLNHIEGNNTWMIIVNDTSGVILNDTVSFWVDSISPSLNFVLPYSNPGYSSSNDATAQINYTETNPKSITYQVYDSNNNLQSSIFQLSPFTLIATKSGLPEGIYYHFVTIEDTIGHTTTLNRTEILDVTKPSIQINYPLNDSNHKGTINIQTNASDNLAGINSIDISIKNLSNDLMGSNVCNNQETCDYSWNSASVVDGTYYIISTATDKATNSNTTNPVFIEVDNTNPQIYFNSPNESIYKINQTINITAYDAHLSIIKLYIDGENLVNSSTSELIYQIGEGEYEIFAIAYDSFGNSNLTENRTIVIDSTSPIINLTGENPQSIEFGNSYLELNATAEDNIDGNLTLNISIDSSSVNTSIVGFYNVTYYVEDRAGNNFTKIRIVNVSDTIGPSITLTSPQNNKAFDFGSEILLEFNKIDFSAINNCSLIFLGELNQSGNVENFTIHNLSSGKYNFSVQCRDGFNNLGESETRYFTILSNISFEDNSTEFTNLSNQIDITNVSYFFIGNSFGNINWTSSIDFSSGIDWSSCLNISYNRVEVNSSCFAGFNVSARIVMYNLTWSNPQILKDASICSSCNKISYNSTTGEFIFDVTSFSVYTTQETPVTVVSSSGGGSSSCTATWECESWSVCEDGTQTRTCTKTNSCSRGDSPLTSQNCEISPLELEEELPSEIIEEIVEEDSVGFFSRMTGAITGAAVGTTGRKAITLTITLLLTLAGAYFGVRYLKTKAK